MGGCRDAVGITGDMNRAEAAGARSCPTHEPGSPVLGPAVSMVSIGPQGYHDHPAPDPCALASSWLPSVLALEIPLQVTEAFPWAEAPRYLIRDRDRVYGAAVTRRLRAMSIRDKPIAPGSPWQNGFAERLIGSIRRECVDHIVVLGEAHLRRILTKYSAYYNELRTHRSLGKDAPISRAIQHVGCIASKPVVGGLHHHYCRI